MSVMSRPSKRSAKESLRQISVLYDAGDLAAALKECRRLAASGSVEGMAVLGLLAEVISADEDQAARWYELAGSAGSVWARHQHQRLTSQKWRDAACHYELQPTAPQDLLAGTIPYVSAFSWFDWIRAARLRTSNARVALLLARAAEMTALDQTEGAFVLYRKAARRGSTAAMVHLGDLHASAREAVEREKWWLRAAVRGNGDAMLRLGQLLWISESPLFAIKWWMIAAQVGHGESMLHLGMACDEVDNLAGARIWYHLAASVGNVVGMRNLMLLYHQQGNGHAARKWGTRAANAGDSESADFLRSTPGIHEDFSEPSHVHLHLPSQSNSGRTHESAKAARSKRATRTARSTIQQTPPSGSTTQTASPTTDVGKLKSSVLKLVHVTSESWRQSKYWTD